MTEKSAYLRSINLVFDADSPERIAHFQPTAKSVTLMRSLAGLTADRAFFVTAPYGSGKSLTATYLLHLIQNRPKAKSVLKTLERRLSPISPDMAKFAARRRKKPALRGIVLAMEGYQDDVGKALQSAAVEALNRLKMGREARSIRKIHAAGADGAIAVLSMLCDKARQSKCDRIVILWDEFGRHLETLVAAGESAKIGDIQQVAEFASRSSTIPVTFSGIMHQGLLNYAGTMSQSSLAVWRKVEGRFTPIQYVDDSKELYRLIGKLVGNTRTEVRDPRATYKNGKGLRELGLLRDFSDEEVDELLERAYPLEAVTLYLLPRLAARAAQNERTLFGFIYSCEQEDPVTPADLFDYFEPAMRSDTGIGGTYRSWLETESAISKARSELEVAALKTVCLLSLGLSGERTRATPELLEYALSGGRTKKEVKSAISALIKRKLLLRRKHAGEIAIWHGTDVDLRGRLAEEQAKVGEEFDVEVFLEQEFPPPVWRPTQYNDENQLRRYLTSRYLTPSSLASYLDNLAQKGLPIGSDGAVVYVICDKEEEIRAVLEKVKEVARDDRVVFAIPALPANLREAATEVTCLELMQVDDKLLDRDPLVANELQQMLDDSRAHLSKLIGRMISPAAGNIHWFYRGKPLDISSPSQLRRELSEILARVFSKTPRFNNEMIIRQRPSPNIVNSRKKLVLGILERNGEERLGLEGEFADASMFRTILFNNGLYFQDKSKRWRFAQPDELDDEKLVEVWTKFKELLTQPQKTPKDLVSFFRKLQEPPYGLRFGVIPILFASAMKAFPSPLSIVRANGEYVGDILPTEIEEICKAPQNFRLSVLPIGLKEESYLAEIRDLFDPDRHSSTETTDLIRECFDAIEQWKYDAPPGALTSRLVSKKAQKLQVLLRRNTGPTDFLFNGLPRLADSNDFKFVSNIVSLLHKELSSINDIYRERVARAIKNVLSTGLPDSAATVRDLATDWADCFPGHFVEIVDDAKCRAFLNQLKGSFLNDATFVNTLVTMVVDKAPRRWDDDVIFEFEKQLQDMVNRIENQALESADMDGEESAGLNLVNLLERRITGLVMRLEQISGKEAVHKALSLHFDSKTEVEDQEIGHTSRSA